MAKKKGKEKKEKAEVGPLAAGGRLVDLMVAGDHRAARAEARRALGDPAADEAGKAAARDILARTSIEPGALAVGLCGVAILAIVVALVR